jgi:hypothetical protein
VAPIQYGSCLQPAVLGKHFCDRRWSQGRLGEVAAHGAGAYAAWMSTNVKT